MEVNGQRNSQTALTPGKIRYQLCLRIGKPQDRSGWLRKMSSPPGFDPRTSQLVASRCIDYAIPLKTKINRNCLLRLNSSRVENAILLGYKNQSVHAVWGNNRCLCWDPYRTRKHTVWAECTFLVLSLIKW